MAHISVMVSSLVVYINLFVVGIVTSKTLGNTMYNTNSVNGRAAKFASDTIIVLKTFAPDTEPEPIGITLTWPQLEQMIKANYQAAVETENVYTQTSGIDSQS